MTHPGPVPHYLANLDNHYKNHSFLSKHCSTAMESFRGSVLDDIMNQGTVCAVAFLRLEY
jgi:hypothetical protein